MTQVHSLLVLDDGLGNRLILLFPKICSFFLVHTVYAWFSFATNDIIATSTTLE